MVNLYRVPGPTAKESAPPERIISSSGIDLDPHHSPDGSRIVFGSTRSGKPEVWTCTSEGQECSRLASGFNPAWSPDGKSVAYTAGFDTGMASIFVIHAEGGIPRQLTYGTEDYLPSWSSDADSIYFLTVTEHRGETWQVPVVGGEPRQVTQGGGVNAMESSDGRYLFYATHKQVRQAQIWRMELPEGEMELVVDTSPDYMNWDLWRDNIVYLNPHGEEGPRLEMVDPETRQSTLIQVLERSSVHSRGLSVSPDGQWIVFGNRDVAGSDLILVKNFHVD